MDVSVDGTGAHPRDARREQRPLPLVEVELEQKRAASLLEAARLGDKVDAFEDEEIDLEAILEAHRAGDLMDLLREVGLKAGERLRVKRALGP